MDLGLKDRVAIVAASSRGLGRASALALAREGARVTICAREQDALERAAEEIRAQTQAEVLAVPADLAHAEAIRGVVEATVERFGGVDVLVTNSGGPPPGKFAELADEDWQRAFELVTLNFVRFVREVEPHMRKNGWGRIIAIQSTSVKEPVEYLDLSNGIRPGIAGLMKAIMPDLAEGRDHDQPRAPGDLPHTTHQPCARRWRREHRRGREGAARSDRGDGPARPPR